MKKASLADVFQYLRQVSEYKFVYDSDAVKQFQPVSVDLKGVGLEEVLEDCLKGSPFVFLIEDDLVIIREQKSVPQKQTQEVKIVGKVTDEKGSLLPGVTVQIQGTSLGTVTDTDGKYVLSVPEMKELTLVYSFIGMEKKAVRWKGEKELNITLVTEVAEMDEVVVTGVFTRKKESFTGSSATFTNKELKMIGNSNVLESLKTLDPSFAIIENNDFGSDPNHLPNIEIRGKTSVIGLTEEYNTDPNQPLFILDGFESTLATISDLSMDRVQSITVLKDAAATAIYGSKAANGVVVVETKAPEAGQLRLNYTGNLNFTFADLSDYNLMNAEEKLQFELLSGLYQSWGPDGYLGSVEQERKYNMRLQEVRRGVDTYWMNEPLRFATTHKHNLFLEGGDGVMRYGVGVSYGKTQGVMKGSDRDVLNGNVRLIYRKGRVAFTNSLNVDYTRAERESVSFKRFAQTNPYYRKTDENGEPVKVLESFSYFDINTFRIINENVYGPFYDLSNTNFDRTHTLGITNNFEADWRVIDELRIRARIGVNKSNEQAEKFSSPFNSEFVGKEDNEKGAYTESEKHVFGYDGDLSVTYGKLLAERHMVNAVAGMRFTQSTSNLNGYTMRGFIDDEFSNPSFAQEYNPDKKVYQDVKKRTASYYVNLGYAYDNRYLLDANWRADGASIFGVNKLFTNTWSVGLGWNIHNEHFLEGAGWLDMLKLRVSYGTLGNNATSTFYMYQPLYASANYVLGNAVASGLAQTTLANPNLTWETTHMTNIGLDYGLFDHRLSGSVDVFNRLTTDILISLPAPLEHGTSAVPNQNAGKVRNRGIDFDISWFDHIGSMTYSLGFHMGYVRNKVTKFQGKVPSINGVYKLQEGKPINQLYVMSVDRIVRDQSDLDYVQSLVDKNPDYFATYQRPELGDFLYADANHDGNLDANDRIEIGNGDSPAFTFGSNIGISWKGFDFSMLLQGVGKHKVYYNNQAFRFVTVMGQSLNKDITDHAWTPENPYNSKYPRLRNNANSKNNIASDALVFNASYLRCKNIQLGYTLPSHISEKFFVENLKIYTSIDNLFTLTDFPGLDPEIAAGVGYPQLRQYSVGINVTF